MAADRRLPQAGGHGAVGFLTKFLQKTQLVVLCAWGWAELHRKR